MLWYFSMINIEILKHRIIPNLALRPAYLYVEQLLNINLCNIRSDVFQQNCSMDENLMISTSQEKHYASSERSNYEVLQGRSNITAAPT